MAWRLACLASSSTESITQASLFLQLLRRLHRLASTLPQFSGARNEETSKGANGLPGRHGFAAFVPAVEAAPVVAAPPVAVPYHNPNAPESAARPAEKSPEAPAQPVREMTTKERISALEKIKDEGTTLNNTQLDELSQLKTTEMKERFDQMMNQNSFQNKIRTQ